MIDGLKPYPGYRDSRLPWIGKVPQHWNERRAKYFLKEIDQRSDSGEEELLSVSHLTGVTPRSQKNVTMFLSESNVGHKLCLPGDVVVNTMWAWMGAVGVTAHSGLVSPSYGVYRPLLTGRFVPKFLDHLLRCPSYVHEFVCRSTGITTSRLRLYPDVFLRIPLVCPPLDEQASILRFLDHAERRIRRYIRAKQKLMALVAEERDAITEDSLRRKGSRSLRLEAAAQRIARLVDRQSDQLYTPIGLYNRGRGIFHKTPVNGSELGDSTFFWLAEGDLVVSGQFAWEGAVALCGRTEDGCVASHRYPIFRGKPGIVESAYLLSFFRTGWGQLLLDHHSRGAAGRNRPLNVPSLMTEQIPVPSLDAQLRIAELVRLELGLRETIAGLVTLLREYRTRLIADVVTGKLDVRDAAAQLPAVDDEQLADDGGETISETDTDNADLDAAQEEAEA